MKNLLIILLMLVLASCRSSRIKYEHYLAFLNSAQANSMEFPIKIKGKVCLDLEGITGLCSTRINSNQDFIMTVDAQEYGYRYKLTCSKEANADQIGDVIKGQAHKLVVPAANIVGLKSFICIGEIFPEDRTQEVSAKWEVRVKIQDEKYQSREAIYETEVKGKKVIVLGRNALYSTVCYDDECKRYVKATTVLKQDKQGLSVYSESHNMRYNFYKE